MRYLASKLQFVLSPVLVGLREGVVVDHLSLQLSKTTKEGFSFVAANDADGLDDLLFYFTFFIPLNDCGFHIVVVRTNGVPLKFLLS